MTVGRRLLANQLQAGEEDARRFPFEVDQVQTEQNGGQRSAADPHGQQAPISIPGEQQCSGPIENQQEGGRLHRRRIEDQEKAEQQSADDSAQRVQNVGPSYRRTAIVEQPRAQHQGETGRQAVRQQEHQRDAKDRPQSGSDSGQKDRLAQADQNDQQHRQQAQCSLQQYQPEVRILQTVNPSANQRPQPGQQQPVPQNQTEHQFVAREEIEKLAQHQHLCNQCRNAQTEESSPDDAPLCIHFSVSALLDYRRLIEPKKAKGTLQRQIPCYAWQRTVPLGMQSSIIASQIERRCVHCHHVFCRRVVL